MLKGVKHIIILYISYIFIFFIVKNDFNIIYNKNNKNIKII